MNISGIIAEYNPFHSGHARQIAETRRLLGEDAAVVCAMSGNWVQRADCAIADKWTRAAVALKGGADLVLELPTPWAISSAERFARGAVEVLSAAGVVSHLSFGSESGSLEELRAAAVCLDSQAYPSALRRALDQGLPFPAARQEAVAIPRTGAGHDQAPAAGFASASWLRGRLRAGYPDAAAPYLTGPWIWETADLVRCERAILARLRSMTLEQAEALPDSGDGLAARLLAAGKAATTLEEVYALTKTRRYTHARVRRLVLWAFLGLTAADRPEHVPYLRVLGFNDRGRAVLREMWKHARLPILTKPAHVRTLSPAARRLFELEDRCTDLYGLCLPTAAPGGREWTTNPAILPVK
ncbi:nucleotidyltransferase family protein [Intestinimonas sp.]|uniref:tRNA(Met) cytidine acetate ligase n=1 Tax=Intestinimonas sp. TaxID=1965293 RepID=UPI003AAAFEE3